MINSGHNVWIRLCCRFLGTVTALKQPERERNGASTDVEPRTESGELIYSSASLSSKEDSLKSLGSSIENTGMNFFALELVGLEPEADGAPGWTSSGRSHYGPWLQKRAAHLLHSQNLQPKF